MVESLASTNLAHDPLEGASLLRGMAIKVPPLGLGYLASNIKFEFLIFLIIDKNNSKIHQPR